MEFWSYNGVVLPKYSDSGGWYHYLIYKHENGYVCFFTIGGNYQYYNGNIYVYTSGDNSCGAMYWEPGYSNWSTFVFSLELDEELQEKYGASPHYLCPADAYVWVEDSVGKLGYSSNWRSGSTPLAVEGLLDATPSRLLTPDSTGPTGITIGAVIKNGDTIMDVSALSTYQIIPGGAGWLDESRQLILADWATNAAISITTEVLPEQATSITVVVGGFDNDDTGGDDSGGTGGDGSGSTGGDSGGSEGGDSGDTGGGDDSGDSGSTSTNIAEAYKSGYMAGLATGLALYSCK